MRASSEVGARVVDGKVQATLTFANWLVRYLGTYLLFLDDPRGQGERSPLVIGQTS
jgi:hypothetical protein